MALKVITFATYLSTVQLQWRGIDHDAHDFIKGLKGEAFSGYANIKVQGKYRRLKNDNLDDAIEWFGLMAADYLRQNTERWPITLVPVPNSKSIVGGPAPRPLKIAYAIEKTLADSSVADLLRWKEQLPSAHQEGGTRDPAVLYKNLKLIGDIPDDPIILVDDVLTSGGHIQACAAFILKKGGELLFVVCAGRTVYSQKPNPFEITTEQIPEYTP